MNQGRPQISRFTMSFPMQVALICDIPPYLHKPRILHCIPSYSHDFIFDIHCTCLILFTYSLTHHIHTISFPVYHHKMLSLKKQIPVSFTMKPLRNPAAPAHHCCQMKMPSEERGSNLASSTGGLLVEVFLSVRQLQVVISSLHDIWVHSTGEPNRNQ